MAGIVIASGGRIARCQVKPEQGQCRMAPNRSRRPGHRRRAPRRRRHRAPPARRRLRPRHPLPRLRGRRARRCSAELERAPTGQHAAAAGRPGRVRPPAGTGRADRAAASAASTRWSTTPAPSTRRRSAPPRRRSGTSCSPPTRARPSSSRRRRRRTCAPARGAIVNLVDIHAERPLRGHTVYVMAKAALAAMTRSLALELAPEVRVNGVAPGAVLWPEQGKSEAAQGGAAARPRRWRAPARPRTWPKPCAGCCRTRSYMHRPGPARGRRPAAWPSGTIGARRRSAIAVPFEAGRRFADGGVAVQRRRVDRRQRGLDDAEQHHRQHRQHARPRSPARPTPMAARDHQQHADHDRRRTSSGRTRRRGRRCRSRSRPRCA